MVGVIIIMLIAAIICSVAVVYIQKTCPDISGWAIWLYTVSVGILASSVLVLIESDKPSALDVYREKTELVVYSKNDVPYDSLVVFKVTPKNEE